MKGKSMKKLLFLVFCSVIISSAFAQTYVSPYFKSDGTYVSGYYKSASTTSDIFKSNSSTSTSTWNSGFKSSSSLYNDDVKVDGYFKSSGTKVESHYRTAPNNTILDNYSTYGNTNPYTGKQGTKKIKWP